VVDKSPACQNGFTLSLQQKEIATEWPEMIEFGNQATLLLPEKPAKKRDDMIFWQTFVCIVLILLQKAGFYTHLKIENFPVHKSVAREYFCTGKLSIFVSGLGIGRNGCL
jgi:hypothetical protein